MSLLTRTRVLARSAATAGARHLSALAAAASSSSSSTGSSTHRAATHTRLNWQRVLTGAVAFTALATGVRAASNAAAAAAGTTAADNNNTAASSSSSSPAAAASASSAAAAAAASPAALFPSGKLRVGLVQLSVGADKSSNIAGALSEVRRAAAQGAQLVVLPEMWNCPYNNSSFGPYSEPLPEVGATASQLAAMACSPSAHALSALARTLGIWLVAGSVPERSAAAPGQPQHARSGLQEHLYNTCMVFSPSGDLVAKHRKLHLFDIDVPGRMTFRESDTLSAGNEATVFDTPFGKVGLGICYDIRFGEYAALMAAKGARMLIYPGAFNTTTGPLHWELLQRARAVDNQLWVLTCSPARSADTKAYQAWGHSSAVSPWGRVLATTDHQPAVVLADIDFSEVDDMRKMIPVATQKRTDVYKLAQ